MKTVNKIAAGFTLIEVIIALTLAGLAIAALAGTLSQAVYLQKSLEGRVNATTFGQGKLAELESGAENASSGDFILSNHKLRWSSREESVGNGFFKIYLTVEWGEDHAPVRKKDFEGWRYDK